MYLPKNKKKSVLLTDILLHFLCIDTFIFICLQFMNFVLLLATITP